MIPSRKHLGGFLPYAFTEHGVAMLSGVLRSQRAIQVNVAIVRAFVKLRRVLAIDRELGHRVARLEGKVEMHDTDIRLLVQDIRKLKSPPEKTGPSVRGFSRE